MASLPRTALTTVIVFAALAASSIASANATVYTGSIAPTHVTATPATNVRSMNVSVDNQTGVWKTIISFRGTPRKTTRAKMYLAFAIGSTNSCNSTQGGFVEITMKASKATAVLRDSCLGDNSGPPPSARAERNGCRWG